MTLRGIKKKVESLYYCRIEDNLINKTLYIGSYVVGHYIGNFIESYVTSKFKSFGTKKPKR